MNRYEMKKLCWTLKNEKYEKIKKLKKKRKEMRDGEVERKMENVGRLERRMDPCLQPTGTSLHGNREINFLFWKFVSQLLKIIQY